ncbi:MAG: hypothetical protein IAB88_06700 [Bacteroidetes bacterium]|uniref:Uncharacterized protein n=1 Tax=Candidatus Limisoma faecipullorum TaxID=2840854 RepID=A0A9D9IR60_9BACT|nr:hypothetical protein [Candidatus Limisoma faecipullorum]
MKTKIKKSTYLPAILLVYLLCMAYIGKDILLKGDYLYYFSVFGLSLIIIILLHFSLKKKEKRDEEKQLNDKNNKEN